MPTPREEQIAEALTTRQRQFERGPRCPARRTDYECENPPREPHVCPYGEELYNDFKLCRCCRACTSECAANI